MSVERKIIFEPAFDKGRVGGNHCVTMHMAIVGEKGAIVAHVFTGWFFRQNRHGLHSFPMVSGITIHARSQITDRETSSSGSEGVCDFFGPGEKCWYYGLATSLFEAQRLFDERMLAEGGEAFWVELERIYRQEFGS